MDRWKGQFQPFLELISITFIGHPLLGCDLWSQMFMDAAEHCVPHKIIEVRPSDFPWYSSELWCLRRKVHRAYDKGKASGCSRDRVVWHVVS